MLLATGVTVAGYAIEITFHDAVVIGLAILISLAFWAVLHFSRKRVVYLSHSEATNQIMLELSRIAVALQDIANRPADQIIASAVNRRDREEREQQLEPQESHTPAPQVRAEQPPIPPEHVPERQPRGMPYSLFGR